MIEARHFLIAMALAGALTFVLLHTVRVLGDSAYFQQTMHDQRIGVRNHSGVEPWDPLGIRRD